MRTIAKASILASMALVAGCAATPLKERFTAVGKEIKAAQRAGAPDYAPADYVGAEHALALAKDSESAALDASEAAEEAREQARLDLAELGKQMADREAALEEAGKRSEAADVHLAALLRRQAQLRAKGVSDKEIDRALGDDIALGQLEVSSARASIKTVQAEIELLKVRRDEAHARVASATEGIAVAGQQLLHASALCDTAGASARMAQAHAIARRKAELEVR